MAKRRAHKGEVMSDTLIRYGIASYTSQKILIVPFQADFYSEVMEVLQRDILSSLHQTPDIKGLIIDVTNIKVMDLFNIKTLEKTLLMASMLGVESYLVGLQPQVTLTLIDLGYEIGKTKTALSIEQATICIHRQMALKEIGLIENDAHEAKDENTNLTIADTDSNNIQRNANETE